MSDELTELVIEEADEKMAKAIERVQHEFAGVRTGRANSGLVEHLLVDYYGTPTPLSNKTWIRLFFCKAGRGFIKKPSIGRWTA